MVASDRLVAWRSAVSGSGTLMMREQRIAFVEHILLSVRLLLGSAGSFAFSGLGEMEVRPAGPAVPMPALF
jgi:hypothetical protein